METLKSIHNGTPQRSLKRGNAPMPSPSQTSLSPIGPTWHTTPLEAELCVYESGLLQPVAESIVANCGHQNRATLRKSLRETKKAGNEDAARMPSRRTRTHRPRDPEKGWAQPFTNRSELSLLTADV